MSDTKDYSAFLRDLETLALKHGLVICGCGCCGSPLVVDAPKRPGEGFYRTDKDSGENLKFVHPSSEYNWERYGKEKP